MAVYDSSGNEIYTVYDSGGNILSQVYDTSGNELLNTNGIVYTSAHSSSNLYAGGLLEIQPDSWDGSTVVTGDTVSTSDSTAWGFPMSLSDTSKTAIKNDIYSGNGYGVSFIRFPMGFAYRGSRNIDADTGLAKNIGERWNGQNSALASWFSSISAIGGGLDVEYWCLAPYWLTGGAYYNADVVNEVWAGGSYERTTTLSSIKSTDSEQYNAQIEALTDAIVNDLEYLHQNVAPVRMYTLAAEPTGTGQLKYGHTHWTSDVYNDVFAVLHPKVLASEILATYDSKSNIVLMHLCANNSGFTIGSTMIANYPSWIWGFSHDTNIKAISGDPASATGADLIKASSYPVVSSQTRTNFFICEYEYFHPAVQADEYKCSNNIVRMIFELVYGKAKIIMPIIHVCKPTGQNYSSTNTAGYCLYAVDMDDGSYTVNTWAYNSWKMFNDNLPIGAEFVTGGDGGLSNAGYAEFEYNDKLYILLGNYASTSQSITLAFSESKTFSGKLYNMTNLGTAQSDVTGSSITFTIPAYSGLVYVEN